MLVAEQLANHVLLPKDHDRTEVREWARCPHLTKEKRIHRPAAKKRQKHNESTRLKWDDVQ